MRTKPWKKNEEKLKVEDNGNFRKISKSGMWQFN